MQASHGHVSGGVGAHRRSNGPGGAPLRAAQLNSLSCIYCRQKKIRCNRKDPCSNCIKVRVECIFPQPARIARKKRDTASAELSARMRQLEETVFSLSENIKGNIDTMASPAVSSSPPALGSTAGTTDTENRGELVNYPSRKAQFADRFVPDKRDTVTEGRNYDSRGTFGLATREKVRIVLIAWCQPYGTSFRASSCQCQ